MTMVDFGDYKMYNETLMKILMRVDYEFSDMLILNFEHCYFSLFFFIPFL